MEHVLLLASGGFDAATLPIAARPRETTAMIMLNRLVLAVAAALFIPAAAAAPLYVNAFGESGWNSVDTRNTAGTSLTQPADAAAIAAQINPSATHLGRSSVSLDGTTSNSGKSSFGTWDTTGFANGAALTAGFTADYSWASTGSSLRTSPLKIGLDISGVSGSAPVTPRTGEDRWDYILVHALPSTLTTDWHDESISYSSGTWNVFRSGYLGGGALRVDGTFGGAAALVNMTLQDMQGSAGALGTILNDFFASTTNITAIEFGIGSSQRNAVNHIEYLRTSIYNGGDAVFFGRETPIPTPGTLVLLALGLLGLGVSRRRGGA